jgi:FMN phosphatase YigB (HAD superfamily)
MNLTTVLLDAGGVLLDEAEMEVHRAELTARFLTRHGHDCTPDDYWADVEEAVHAFDPEAYRYVFRKHGCEDLYAAFLEEWRPGRPPLRLMEGAAEALHALTRRFRVGIAGQYGAEVIDLLESHGLLDCFAWRFTQDDFTRTKPDPRYFQQIVDACGVDAGECILVGARIDKDVIPAKQLGMRTIRIRVGLHRHQQPRVPSEAPDVTLESVAGLADAAAQLAT